MSDKIDLIWGASTAPPPGKSWGKPMSQAGLAELDTIAKDLIAVKFITNGVD